MTRAELLVIEMLVYSIGQPKRTIERQDKYLRKLALQDRFFTTREVWNQWLEDEGRPVSM